MLGYASGDSGVSAGLAQALAPGFARAAPGRPQVNTTLDSTFLEFEQRKSTLDDGTRIVGWLLTSGVSIALVLWVWMLLRSKDPNATLGPLARAQLLFFGAVLAHSLAMALGYPSSWVGWTLIDIRGGFHDCLPLRDLAALRRPSPVRRPAVGQFRFSGTGSSK